MFLVSPIIVSHTPLPIVNSKLIIMFTLLILVVVFFSAPVFSSDKDASVFLRSSHSRYVGLSLGLLDREDTPADEFLTNSGLFFPNGATRIFIGYRLNKNITIERGYDDIENESGIDTVTSNGVTTDYPYTIIIDGIDVAAIYGVDISNRVSAYGKAGVAILHTKLYNKHFFGEPTDIDETNFLPLIAVVSITCLDKGFRSVCSELTWLEQTARLLSKLMV